MSDWYGFAGRNLYVDLTSGVVRKEPLDPGLVRKFVGGMGIASKLLYDLVPMGTEALSPQNVFIMATTPFTGTMVPGASRTYVAAKSPLSGFWGQANGGHSAGTGLKFAGYDNLIITGKADRPVYLKVFDEAVEILDARHLWGKDTWETVDLIRDELGYCSVSCIGPAGENLVKFASIKGDKRSGMNKTGLGAVLGSKNLKAIATRGTKGVAVADRRRFRKMTDDLLSTFASLPLTLRRRQFASALAWTGPRAGFDLDDYKQRVWEKPYACLGCPVGCKALVHLKDGKYAGLAFNFSQLSSLCNHHRLARVENWDELAKLGEMEDRAGLDGGAVAGILNLLVTLREEGIINPGDVGGLDLAWGGESIRNLIPMITYRQGIGDLLAEGARAVALKLGKEADKYANHIKGVQREPELDEASIFQTASFSALTSAAGAHGGRGGSNTANALKDPEAFRAYCRSIGVLEGALDRVCKGVAGYNVARLTRYAEDYNMVPLTLGVCTKAPVSGQIGFDMILQLYEAATGLRLTTNDAIRAGERIFTLQKTFTVCHGWKRADDIPGTWHADKPVIVGGKSYGTPNQLLDEYYEERGWNISTGLPPASKLIELGI